MGSVGSLKALGALSPQMPSKWVTFMSDPLDPVHPRSPVQPDTQTRSLGSPLDAMWGSVRSGWTLTASPHPSARPLAHFWARQPDAAPRVPILPGTRPGHSTRGCPPGAGRGTQGAGTGPAGTDGLRVGSQGGQSQDLLGSRPLPQEAGAAGQSRDGGTQGSQLKRVSWVGKVGPEATAPGAQRQLLRRNPGQACAKSAISDLLIKPNK